MARQRDPRRDQAKQIWLKYNGEKLLKDIAEELGISDSQIRKWKSQDKWAEELKGNVTSSVHVDDDDISRLKASSNPTVVVQHKQVVPQVTIHIDNKDGEPIDEEALLQKFEDKVIELIDSDLS